MSFGHQNYHAFRHVSQPEDGALTELRNEFSRQQAMAGDRNREVLVMIQRIDELNPILLITVPSWIRPSAMA